MSGSGNSPFDRWTDRDIIDLVAAYPLAWVVSASSGFAATPLPILLETDESGRPASLIGHFAKSNYQVDQVRADPRTLFLFSGPNAYISPELVSTTRNWAPTWNYAIARIVADIAFDETFNDAALDRLVECMEAGRAEPWNKSYLGPRYERMRGAIVAFRAPIVSIEARFKLGQDERAEVFADIANHYDGQDLGEWMHRFNPDRG